MTPSLLPPMHSRYQAAYHRGMLLLPARKTFLFLLICGFCSVLTICYDTNVLMEENDSTSNEFDSLLIVQ